MRFILFAIIATAINFLLESVCNTLGWTQGIMVNTVSCTICACMLAKIVMKIIGLPTT